MVSCIVAGTLMTALYTLRISIPVSICASAAPVVRAAFALMIDSCVCVPLCRVCVCVCVGLGVSQDSALTSHRETSVREGVSHSTARRTQLWLHIY